MVKKVLGLIGLGVAVLVVAQAVSSSQLSATAVQSEPVPAVDLGPVTIDVSIARTLPERIQGLSGTESLPAQAGKLFIFEQSEHHGIWMKDMQYPLDIFWLDTEYRIVHIEKNVSQYTYPETFRPSIPAQYVLETNAGIAEEYSIQVGGQTHFIEIGE